jgi:hypothetical protein
MTERRWSASIKAPERELSSEPLVGPAWIVTVYNNDVNTYEEVMTVLMLATCCTAEEAYIEAWEIDHYGQCVVHRADEDECKGVAEVVSTIGIRVEATPES